MTENEKKENHLFVTPKLGERKLEPIPTAGAWSKVYQNLYGRKLQ